MTEIERKKNKGVRRLMMAAGYSMDGLKAAWKTEEAFRIECIIALIMIPIGLFLGTAAVQKALLVLSCLIVLIAELVNASIEAAIDRIGPEHHMLSKMAKDFGSAAVFISLCAVVTVWGLILYERFMA